MTTMELHPDVRLPLPPGRYRVDATQTMDVATQPLPTRTHHLVIDVPRVTMSGTEVFSVSPPPNAVGPYAGRLAQITLRRRALPWARSGDTGPPWLALVVLADGEGEFATDVPITEAFSSGVYSSLPERPPATTRADALSVSRTVVDRVFPAESELRLMSHVRQVDTDDTEYADDDGWVSVVLSNRLPLPGQRYRAYLISVEGQHDVLPTPGAVANEIPFTWALADFVVNFIVANGTDSVSTSLVDLVVAHSDSAAIDLAGTGIDISAHVDRDGLGSSIRALADADGPSIDARGDIVHSNASARVASVDDAAARRVAAANAANTAAGVRGDSSRTTVSATSAAGLTVAGLYAEVLALMPPEPTFQFPVLAHWEFECSDDGRDFAGYMSRLDVGMIGATSRNRFEKDADEQGAADAVRGERASADTARRRPDVAATGHLSVQHIERSGTTVDSWYRSPLVPSQTTRRAAGEPAHVADQLVALTEDGRWDTTYAAAFEIGRLLAMSDLQFLRSLRAFAKDGFAIRRRRQLYGSQWKSLIGRQLDLAHSLDLRLVIDRALVSGGLGVDPRVALGDPLRVQTGPLIQPAEQIEALATGFDIAADEVASVLGTGPTTVPPGRVDDPFLSFDDLVGEGVPVVAELDREIAVGERLRGVEQALAAGGGIDGATKNLLGLLEDLR